MWLTATHAGVGGKVVDGRAPSHKGRRSPQHRVMSGTSCQDSHSPDAQAKVKIKSLEESRRVGLTQQVTPLIMRVCEHCATPLGVPEFYCSSVCLLVSSMAHPPGYERSCLLWYQRWLTCPGRALQWSSKSYMKIIIMEYRSKISLWRSFYEYVSIHVNLQNI